MRIHKIDNDRTRRNMYRDAAERRSFFIPRDDIVRNGEDWWRDLIRNAERRMRKELRWKYDKHDAYLVIEARVYTEYDIDFNRYRVVLEARNPTNVRG